MTDGVIIRISLTALLRRQPERSEVSLYIICIMADRVSLYFIGDCPRSYLGESSKTAPHWRIKQNCSTNEESTILGYSVVKGQIKNLTHFQTL